MTHIPTERDADLHNADGTHRNTPAHTGPRYLATWDDRIAKHLELHQAEPNPLTLIREWFRGLTETQKKELNLPLAISPRGKVAGVVKAAYDARAGAAEVPPATFSSAAPPTRPAKVKPPAPILGETVELDRVYVWLLKNEAKVDRPLPSRVLADDMWPSAYAALNRGRKNRLEDARWLVIASGHTRKITELVLA